MPDWATSWQPPVLPGDSTVPSTPAPRDAAGGNWWDDFVRSQSTGTRHPGDILPGVDVGQAWSWLSNQFAATPEDQLASAVYEKLGPDVVPTADRHGFDRNLMRARQVAHFAMQNQAYRETLATSMGWNIANPHVKYWIDHAGGVPADPTGTGLTARAPGTAAAVKPSTAAAAATIGSPFDPKAYGGRAGDPGFTYGAVLPPDIAAAAGVDRQWGIDYMLPLGTMQTSPFSGTVTEADFNGPYGNTVVVKLSNGMTYRVAHLESLGVKVGDSVNVGSALGPTGSTGNSTGPHVLIEMRDSEGRPIDPTPIIDSLLKGDSTTAQKYLGDYVNAASAIGGPFLTSDGHLIYPGSNDYNVFFAAQSLWRKRYGGDPPWSFVSSLLAKGTTTTEQIQGVMDQMSSDVPGMNWGQRDSFAADANKYAIAAWSRPLPDSTIQRLAGQGITTAGQLDLWVKSHPASSIEGQDYAAIYDQANPSTSRYWKEPPSPDLVADIHKRMQQGPQ